MRHPYDWPRRIYRCEVLVPSDGISSGFSAVHTIFIIFIVVFVIAVISSIVIGIWKASVLRRGGLNPVVAEEQLETALYQNLRAGSATPAPAPEKSKEERLHEVMDLHERGLISDAELAGARAKIISG
jgi:hypothetical protein